MALVRATIASVSGDRAWNGQTVRWLGLTLALLAACGYASYYAHTNLEGDDDTEQQQDTTISRLHTTSELLHSCRNATVGSTRVARLAGA